MTPASENASTIVCFDLGGVVVRICRSFAQACAIVGIEPPDPARFSTPELRAARAALHADYQLGRLPCDEFFHGVAAHSAGLYSADDIRAVHDAWLLGEYPGIAALIEQLNQTPAIATACLSNTNHRHWLAMTRQLTTTPHAASEALLSITHRLASHELGAAKPDAGIYRRFEQQLGVAPERIIFFDDLEENIAAARLRGWQAHQIDHETDTVAQIAAVLAEARLIESA